MVAARHPSNCSLHNGLQGLVLVISLLLDQVWKLLNAANLSIDSIDEHRYISRMIIKELEPAKHVWCDWTMEDL
jgi:hypothetical protein